MLIFVKQMDYFMEEPILNAHNKEEYPPMHTAELILNGTIEFISREQVADMELHLHKKA